MPELSLMVKAMEFTRAVPAVAEALQDAPTHIVVEANNLLKSARSLERYLAEAMGTHLADHLLAGGVVRFDPVAPVEPVSETDAPIDAPCPPDETT